jgi:signal transduction histidine kinase
MSSKPLQLITLCCLFVVGGTCLAQSPTSSVQRLAALLRSYHSHLLNDSAYLKAVDSVVPVLLPEDSLPEWLGAYREIAFGDKRWGVYRAHYYTYMAIHSSPEFLPEANSKLEAKDGHYREAYQELLREYRIRDSAYYAVSADKDNNLYALTAEENTRAELLRTEEGRRKAERYTTYLFALLALLLLGGIAGFMVYRSRQRHRMLNIQLNLARNFHDEIGPMLLFANALVKKELDERPSPGLAELKAQTAQIMEAVRGIAHDLKSNELSTIDSFGREVTALLEKIRQTTGIDFRLRLNRGGRMNPGGRLNHDGRILSNWQYTHLTKMMHELICNSIKHAGCSRIAVLIESMDERFTISYSDDGRGMEPGSFSAGIGLGNIKERVALLKGSFELRNAWPEGYSIEISIPFV